MMLLAHAISQKFSSPTNNHLRMSSNSKYQAIVQDGRVDIQTKNTGYGGNTNKNAGRNRNQIINAGNRSDESNQIVQCVPRTDSTPSKANVQCYNYNEKGHYARDCQKPKVHDAKYLREQMLLAVKNEAVSHLSNEENDFMLDNAYGEESLDELTASIMLMAPLQPADRNTDTVPSYDQKGYDDQIDSSIIFDDPFVDNNGGIPCGNDVFLNSHEKCVAHHTLSRKSSVKRVLFTSPLATQSKNLSTTSVVTKSRLSVAKTLTATSKVIQLVLWIVDSGCSKHMTGNFQLLINFVEKFMGTVRFRNDYFTAITGYEDYVQGSLTICHVYYVEGLGHNLFLVGQFCDEDLEVAFHSNTCYVRNLEGDDLLTGSRDWNLYTISIFEMAASSPVCLMSRATSTKSWLWHRRLSHLNFGTINQLTSNDLVDGLPKFKYNKDHLCSACEQCKSKKASLLPKLVPSTESKLELLHMDLCGLMRVTSINGKKYSRDRWRLFSIHLGIVYKTLIARTPQQNGVVERRNRTLVEAARTMLIFSKTPKFLWAEAIATACFTQNRSIVHTRHNKTPYELIRGRKPNIQYFHVFGSLCYPTNDHDDLGKMKPKADIGIFIGYSESSRGFRIYNQRTKKIMEIIHVKFDELTAMASECNNLEPKMNCMNFNNSLEDSQSIPSKSDLDNFFGPLYEEYYATSSQEVSDDSAANTTDNDHTSSSLSIVVEQDDAPLIVSSSDEQVSNTPNSSVVNDVANRFV
ncbi:retrovirus-related pol polyprotein from transposon TNT 1-94 [Tanacetum coccineum]